MGDSHAQVIDLMEALKRSLAERQAKGWPERVPDGPFRETPPGEPRWCGTDGHNVTEGCDCPRPWLENGPAETDGGAGRTGANGAGQPWKPKRYRKEKPKPKGQQKLW